MISDSAPVEPDYRAIAEAKGWRMANSFDYAAGRWTWINANDPDGFQVDCSDVGENNWKKLSEFLELIEPEDA
jgi:hypothetical protein